MHQVTKKANYFCSISFVHEDASPSLSMYHSLENFKHQSYKNHKDFQLLQKNFKPLICVLQPLTTRLLITLFPVWSYIYDIV
jgi:hypothetical protein